MRPRHKREGGIWVTSPSRIYPPSPSRQFSCKRRPSPFFWFFSFFANRHQDPTFSALLELDMDMEVDIPAAEELEWLESNALLEDPGEDEFEELEGFMEGTLVEQPASPDRAIPGTISDRFIFSAGTNFLFTRLICF